MVSDSFIEISSPEEHEAYIDAMRQNVGYKPEPEVGIFWFNPEENDIFGIAKDPIGNVEFTAASGAPANGVKTGKVLHRDYWVKLREKAVIRGKSDGIFFQKYTNVPRGRVFQLRDGTFQINVGSWINSADKELLMDLIIDEFNLDGENVKLQEDEHWNIGRSEPDWLGDSDF